jgi:hypothetical protein
MEQVLWFLMGLGLGLALDFVLVKVMLKPLKKKLLVLELALGLDSSQKMERILMLEEELRWSKAKIQAQESDLERMNQKLVQSSGMEAPQWNLSYWRIEGPKLKQKVLDLEMELEQLRSKTLWKQD